MSTQPYFKYCVSGALLLSDRNALSDIVHFISFEQVFKCRGKAFRSPRVRCTFICIQKQPAYEESGCELLRNDAATTLHAYQSERWSFVSEPSQRLRFVPSISLGHSPIDHRLIIPIPTTCACHCVIVSALLRRDSSFASAFTTNATQRTANRHSKPYGSSIVVDASPPHPQWHSTD